MAYILPRAVIVLIAWSTTCLLRNTVTGIDPLVFYIGGAVWAFMGLLSFSYLHSLDERSVPVRVRTLPQVQVPAE